MKKMLWVVISVMMTGEVLAEVIASGDNCGPTCHWELDDKGHITISGTGTMYDHGNSSTLPWKNYMSQIKSVEVQKGITRIGQDSFAYYMTNIKEVYIDPSVTYINNSAFKGTSLTSVIIPPQVSNLGPADSAFSRITTLTEVFCSSAQISSGVCSSEKFSGVAVGKYEETEDGVLKVYNADGSIKGIYPDYGSFSQHGHVVDSYTQKDEEGNPLMVYDGYGQIKKAYAYNPDGSVAIYDKDGKLISLTGKRIFTLEEATALVSGKNTFTIRYR